MTDEELVRRLDGLVVEEKRLGAEVVAHLCEVERRGLFLVYGYSSLYTYCVERLGFSEDVAYGRIHAARAAAQHPSILGHLESGMLSLSSIKAIAPHLDVFGEELIEAACGKSTREVKRLVAELGAHQVDNYAKVSPVAGGKVKLEVVLDAETAQLLEELVDLDRHVDSSGNLGSLIERAVQLYAETRKKARQAEAEAPRAGKPCEDLAPRTVPAEVKRQVIERDDGRCSWVGVDGHQCNERGFLEIDHVTPVAHGGRASDASQVRLLCRAHNQHAARLLGLSRPPEPKPEPVPDRTEERSLLISCLHNMGFTKRQARMAVDYAMAHNPSTDLESLLRSSLQATTGMT